MINDIAQINIKIINSLVILVGRKQVKKKKKLKTALEITKRCYYLCVKNHCT